MGLQSCYWNRIFIEFKFSAISSLQRCIHIITRPRRRAHPVNFSRNLILSPLFRIKCRLVVFTFDVVMTSATEQKLSAVNIPNGKRCNLFWNTVQHLFSQLALKFWRYRRKRLRSSSTGNKSEPSAKSGDLGHGIGIDHIKPIRDEKIPVNLSYGNDHIKPHRWKSS
jgi:hypothetical protein